MLAEVLQDSGDETFFKESSLSPVPGTPGKQGFYERVHPSGGGGGNFIFPANLDSLFLAKLYQYHALSQRTLRNLSFTNINIIEKVLIIYIK